MMIIQIKYLPNIMYMLQSAYLISNIELTNHV